MLSRSEKCELLACGLDVFYEKKDLYSIHARKSLIKAENDPEIGQDNVEQEAALEMCFFVKKEKKFQEYVRKTKKISGI